MRAIGRSAMGRTAVIAMSVLVAQAEAQTRLPPVSYEVDAWGLAEGMPQSIVGSLALDDDGYLWLGTGIGPVRFDGDSFLASPFVAGDVPQRVRALVNDGPRGLLVLVDDDSLRRLGPNQSYEGMDAALPRPAMHLAASRSGTVWVATVSGVRQLSNRGSLPVPGLPDSVVGDIRVLKAAADGGLWVGGSLGLAHVSPGGTGVVVPRSGCREVYDVAPAGSEGAWVASCRGIERITALRAEVVLPSQDTLTWRQVHLEPDGSGLWVTGRLGVRRFGMSGDGRGLLSASFTHALDLGGTRPAAMIGDGYGGVWVGTQGAGLRRVRRLVSRRLTVEHGLPPGPMHHLAPDGSGGMWIGGCGGLAHWRDGRIKVTHAPALGLLTDCVHGLLRTSDGALWVGHLNGLVRIDTSGTGARVFSTAGASYQDVTAMLEDRAGRVWFATSTGTVGYFPPGRSTPTLLPSGLLPSSWPRSMEESAGGLWVGLDQHLAHLEDTVVTRQLDRRDGLPPGLFRDLLPDGDSAMFVASYGAGLAHVSFGGTVRRLVPSNETERMLSAIGRDQGRFWLYGDFGVLIVAEEELGAALRAGRPVYRAVRLGAREGVPEGNGGFPSTWVDESGQLWLATVDGVAVVPLRDSSHQVPPPPARIDRIMLDGMQVAARDSVTIEPSVGAISLSMSAPRFAPGRPPTFYYRLRGHDPAWIRGGAPPIARYANLPPGRYVFEVALGSTAQDPGATVHRLAVRVVPAWWETRLARVVWALLGLGVLWAVGAWLTRATRQRNRKLEREIARRARAEQQAAAAAAELTHMSRLATAGELATSIAHELNQPLTAVMAHAEQARRLASGQGSPELSPALDAIVDQSERAAEVIRSLRAFVNKQPTEDRAVALETTVAETLRLLERELTSQGIRVEVRDERAEPRPVRGQPIQLQQVVVNLVLNACEAVSLLAAGDRRIEIVLAREGADAARLTVADNGRGITPENLSRVFEPFFSTRKGGLGLGLSLSRSITEAHGGRLQAANLPGGGAAFHLILPVEHS